MYSIERKGKASHKSIIEIEKIHDSKVCERE